MATTEHTTHLPEEGHDGVRGVPHQHNLVLEVPGVHLDVHLHRQRKGSQEEEQGMWRTNAQTLRPRLKWQGLHVPGRPWGAPCTAE